MTVQTRRRKRAREMPPVVATRPGVAMASWPRWLALGLMPALFFAAHLTFGADLPVVAQWLNLCLALALCIVIAIPRGRRALLALPGLWPVGAGFAAVLIIAGLSLTSLLPASPHPAWAWLGGNGAVTVNTAATIIEIAKLMGLACCFLVGCVQGSGRQRGIDTLTIVTVLGIAYGVISLLTFLSGVQVLQGDRLSGGFLSSNSGATVFGMLTVIGLAGCFRAFRRSQGQPWRSIMTTVAIPAACVLLSATCLLLTASRTGVAATAVACAVFICWELLSGRYRLSPLLLGAVAFAALIALFAFGGNELVWVRLEKLDADTATRAGIFEPHWRAFLNAPVFGYGLGSFKDINNLIMTDASYRELAPIRALHNVYLQWLEEAGIVGAVPMFGTIALIIGSAILRLRNLQVGQTTLRGLIVANLVVLIHGLTDFSLQMPSIAAFWAFLLGLQFAFRRGRA